MQTVELTSCDVARMSAGSLRLFVQRRQEHSGHHDHLLAVPVHLRRHRCPTVRRNVLHVQRPDEGNRRRLQVNC